MRGYADIVYQDTDVIRADEAPGSLDPKSAVLHSAAFGSLADCAGMAAVLPSAEVERELWWRAVAHGGLGYYARAEADLDRLRRAGGGGELGVLGLSLEASTRASLLRQMGKHSMAADLDGRALALVVGGGRAMLQARADALTGLAADALGRSDHRGARVLLETCAEELGDQGAGMGASDPLWRARLRLLWVRAETAMSAGEADSALESAEAALVYAESVPSERHRVKTLLIGAAAAAVAGQGDAAAGQAAVVRERATLAGLLPLRWAACMLMLGVSPSAAIAAERELCEAQLRRRGGNPG